MAMGVKHPKGRCKYDGKCFRVSKFHWEDFSHELQDGPVETPVSVDAWLTKSKGTADDSSCASTQESGGRDGGESEERAGKCTRPQVLVPETPDPSPAKTEATQPFPASSAKRVAASLKDGDSDGEEHIVAKRNTKRPRVIADSDDEEEENSAPKLESATHEPAGSDEKPSEAPGGYVSDGSAEWQTAGRGSNVLDLTDDVSDMRSFKRQKQRGRERDSDISESDEGEGEEEESDDDAEHSAEQVLSQCELISQSLSHSLGSLAGGGGVASGKEDTVGQPKCVGENGFKLKHYQLVGMNWLRVLHASDVNGILADEMGLGKTVQTIAFLGHLLEREDQRGPHLIVCPASVVSNWERELSTWLPALKVVVYHGSQQERTALRGELGQGTRWDVMLTTYTYFERESCKPDRNFLRKIDFTCVVLDEAHSIKNAASSRYKRLLNLTCQRRFLLTGTPINNSLPELLVLLAFLMPDLFDLDDESSRSTFRTRRATAAPLTCREWSECASSWPPSSSGRHPRPPSCIRGVAWLEIRALVQAQNEIFGRRKRDVLTELVPKVEKLERVELGSKQRQVYSGIISRWKQESQARKTEDEPTTTSSSSSAGSKGGKRKRGGGLDDREGGKRTISNIFCELRKAANHPLLVRAEFNDRTVDTVATHLYTTGYFGNECSKEQVLAEVSGYSDFQLHGICKEEKKLSRFALSQEQIGASAKMQQLAELLPKLKAGGHRVLLFSQWTTMLDIIEEYISGMGVNYLRLDGSTAVQQRQDLLDLYNRDKDILCFLLSTRAGGMGINLTAADTVILHDVDFNPQIDRQAEDRCHRIGQTKPVTVIRLVAAGTVDEEINKLAEQKGKLANEMLDDETAEDADDDVMLLDDENGGGAKTKGRAGAGRGKGQSMQEIIEQMLAKVLEQEEAEGE